MNRENVILNYARMLNIWEIIYERQIYTDYYWFASYCLCVNLLQKRSI